MDMLDISDKYAFTCIEGDISSLVMLKKDGIGLPPPKVRAIWLTGHPEAKNTSALLQ